MLGMGLRGGGSKNKLVRNSHLIHLLRNDSSVGAHLSTSGKLFHIKQPELSRVVLKIFSC